MEPQPIMETVPLDDVTERNTQQPEVLVPEEIPEETPENLTSSDVGGISPPPLSDEGMFESEGNKKKYLFIILGIIGGLTIFFVIFGAIFNLLRGKSNEKITLEYWGLWEDENVMKTVIADYKRVKPNITVNYVPREHTDYRLKVVTRIKEGAGPDIFRFHNTWLPSIIDISAPLSPSVMSKEEYDKTFYEVIRNDLKVGDSYYGIALGIDGLVLVYNNSMFKQAGITSKPQTWDDLVKDADKLRVEDSQGLVTAGIALGTANNIEHFSDILGWMLLQNGASIKNLAAPEAVEVLSNYRQFAEPQLNMWNGQMPKDVNAFIQGKVGMIIVPSWHILNIKKANAELDVKVVPLPKLPGSSPIGLASYWVEGVSKASKHQEEAWEFLKFLSSKDVMTKLYQEQTKVRLFGVPYSRVDLRDTLIQNEYIGPVLEQAPYMKSMPVSARTFDQGLDDEIIGYLRNAVEATEKGVSYEEAFKTASAGVSQVLTKHNIQ